MTAKFGFIGCGNMGGALATAVSKTVESDRIWLCDSFAEKAENLAACLGAQTATVATIAAECDYIFLGVKPQGFDALFDELAPCLHARKTPFVQRWFSN